MIKPDISELPIEVELPQSFKNHNIFVCPVNKEPTGKDNKPQLLSCGHVISKHALDRMARGDRTKFKCHTCPAQMFKEDVKEINFYW